MNLLQLEKFADALPDLDRAVALDREDAASWRHRANAHLRLGNLEQAISDAERSAALDPRDRLTRAILDEARERLDAR